MPNVPALSDNAMWAGIPMRQLDERSIRAILAYKLLELRRCYAVMTREQMTTVARIMEGTDVPDVSFYAEPPRKASRPPADNSRKSGRPAG